MVVVILIIVALILIALTVFIINNSYVHAVKKARDNVINALNEAAIIIDSQQKITSFNPTAEKLIGISAKDALRQHVDTIVKFYTDETPVPYSIYGTINKDENKVSRILILQKKETADKSQTSLTVTKNAFGTNNVLITLLDTSKEEQLEEMKVDFVSMAAHELRTPLTAIRGYASLLQMHYMSQLDDSAKELLSRLIVSTTNLTNLIDNLLSVLRIERNDLTVELKPVDLGIIVKDIFASFKQEALTRKQNYTLTLPDNLPMVMADPFRIGQVFINLIGNAITYTPDNGNIHVIVSDRQDHLEVAIQDSGEGIPKEALPRLFTKFFRVSGSLEQGSKGSGVGLYITKSIVELHKGKIWAESAVGQGSTFTFTLPIATEEEKTHHEQHASTNAFLTVKNGQGIIIRNNATAKQASTT